MNLNDAADETGLVSRDRVLEIVGGMLRSALASGWTYETLGDATKLNWRRIKGWNVEGKEPPLSAALSIMLVLGKSKGVNPILALIGYCGEPLDEASARKPCDIVAGVSQGLATIACAAATGFNHQNRPTVQGAADLIIEELVPLSSVGKAA